MNTKVIIVSGISGSGKSTVVKSLISETSVVCSADHFFMVGDRYNFDPKLLGQAHAHCLRKFTDQLIELYDHSYVGVDVIVVDNTNLTAIEMAPYVALAMAYGASVEIITMVCSPELAAKRNTHGVPFPSVQRMYATLQQRQFPPHWSSIPKREINTSPTPAR